MTVQREVGPLTDIVNMAVTFVGIQREEVLVLR